MKKCLEHPEYQVIRKPRASCETCWRIYLMKKDLERTTGKTGIREVIRRLRGQGVINT